jgi:ubiquinone/menaquinone biosynthesis C-methylase UbiE
MNETERIRAYFRTAGWQGSRGRGFLMQERASLLAAVGAELDMPFGAMRVCDVGCGGGADLAAWRALGVPEERLAGTELVEDRAQLAAELLPSAAIRTVDGFDLPFADASFDVVTASLVISTVLNDTHRRQLIREMHRVSRPGGIVAVYDFVISKPWNRNVSAVTTRQLTEAWRRPDATYRAAPFLPLLELALRLPARIQGVAIRLLPRTHRLWVWRNPSAVA